MRPSGRAPDQMRELGFEPVNRVPDGIEAWREALNTDSVFYGGSDRLLFTTRVEDMAIKDVVSAPEDAAPHPSGPSSAPPIRARTRSVTSGRSAPSR